MEIYLRNRVTEGQFQLAAMVNWAEHLRIFLIRPDRVIISAKRNLQNERA